MHRIALAKQLLRLAKAITAGMFNSPENGDVLVIDRQNGGFDVVSIQWIDDNGVPHNKQLKRFRHISDAADFAFDWIKTGKSSGYSVWNINHLGNAVPLEDVLRRNR